MKKAVLENQTKTAFSIHFTHIFQQKIINLE